jgi:L-amino acid N-acyltransferase YncA
MTYFIRLASSADAEQVQAIYAPYCFTPISFELEAPSVDEMRQRLDKIMPQLPWLVAEEEQRLLGYAYASPHRERAAYRWSVDVSIYIRQGQHRRGLGRALYTSLLQVLALQGYCNAYAGATLPNAGSVGLHEAMGFERVGVYRQVGFKDGAWHDVAWFQRPLQPHPASPSAPRSLQELRGSAELQASLTSLTPQAENKP